MHNHAELEDNKNGMYWINYETKFHKYFDALHFCRYNDNRRHVSEKLHGNINYTNVQIPSYGSYTFSIAQRSRKMYP